MLFQVRRATPGSESLGAHWVSSGWTHLIPGLIVSGVGLGFIEPPLASTAIGVVQPQRAGMASGINVTFRQVGIAVGIALLGTLFTSHLGAAVTNATKGTPLHSHAGAIATAVRNARVDSLFRTLPNSQDGLLVHVLRASYSSALDYILLVGAIITFVSAVLCFVLIRKKDFVAQSWDAQSWEGEDSAGSWPQQGAEGAWSPQGAAGSLPQQGQAGWSQEGASTSEAVRSPSLSSPSSSGSPDVH